MVAPSRVRFGKRNDEVETTQLALIGVGAGIPPGATGSLAAGQTGFNSEALATRWLFCASVNKAVDRNHPAMPPGRRGLSTAEPLALVPPAPPGSHRWDSRRRHSFGTRISRRTSEG